MYSGWQIFQINPMCLGFLQAIGGQQYQMGLPKVSEEVSMMMDTVYCSPLGPERNNMDSSCIVNFCID